MLSSTQAVFQMSAVRAPCFRWTLPVSLWLKALWVSAVRRDCLKLRHVFRNTALFGKKLEHKLQSCAVFSCYCKIIAVTAHPESEVAVPWSDICKIPRRHFIFILLLFRSRQHFFMNTCKKEVHSNTHWFIHDLPLSLCSLDSAETFFSEQHYSKKVYLLSAGALLYIILVEGETRTPAGTRRT